MSCMILEPSGSLNEAVFGREPVDRLEGNKEEIRRKRREKNTQTIREREEAEGDEAMRGDGRRATRW
jgi:hypothetical protein